MWVCALICYSYFPYLLKKAIAFCFYFLGCADCAQGSLTARIVWKNSAM